MAIDRVRAQFKRSLFLAGAKILDDHVSRYSNTPKPLYCRECVTPCLVCGVVLNRDQMFTTAETAFIIVMNARNGYVIVSTECM